MNAPLPINTAFSKLIPNLQLAWDSVSLGYLKTCAYKYKLAIVDGLTSHARNADLEFGIQMHASRERYYHGRAEGLDHDAAVHKAVQYALEATWDTKLNRPWESGNPNKNRKNLIRSIVWYLDRWEKDPLKTIILSNGKPAVELSFRFDSGLQASNGESFLLCGHLDRVVTFQDKIFLSDLKTTKHTLNEDYYDQFTPDNQMSLYTLGGKVAFSLDTSGIIIDAIQVAVTFSEFERGRVITRSEDQIQEWYTNLSVYLRQAETYAIANHWPQNDKACFRCEFRAICAKPPSVRQQWITGNFTRRVWDPLQSRGDI